jgi:flagellar hook-length control protein FliK
MQNAMDIMAMVQKTSMLKQKSDVPSKTLGNEKASFRNELDYAKKTNFNDNQLKSKAVDANPQGTTENKIEKFAKAMSGSNIKANMKEETSVEALEQTEKEEESSLIKAEPAEGQELEENVSMEESAQSVIEMLQQFIQMMEGLKADGTESQSTDDLEAKLQAINQQLEQALAIPATGKLIQSRELLNSLKSDLAELVKHLEAVVENKLDPMQTEQLIKQFTDKLNQAKTQLHQVLQKDVKPAFNGEMVQQLAKAPVKPEGKETVKLADKVPDVKSNDESQQITVNANNTSDSKSNAKNDESSQNEDGESEYKASTQTDVKQTIIGDKPNQEVPKEFVAPQNDKLDFQLNIKQANMNLQKESLVKMNKADILNQVIKKADIFLQDGHQEMIMKLEPESLGKLNLKLVVENGLITAKFVAESQQVKEVLESNFNKLKDTLQEKGIAVQSFSVSVGQEGAQFNSGQGFEQWKRTIKFNSKSSGEYMGLDEENNFSVNPYSYHDGKVDYRA